MSFQERSGTTILQGDFTAVNADGCQAGTPFVPGYVLVKYCCLLCSRSQWEKWECAHCYVPAIITSFEKILIGLQNILQIAMPPHLAKDIWNQTLPMPFRDYLLNPLSGEKIVPQITLIHIHF